MYYNQKKDSWIKHLDFIVLDAICVEISYLFAYMQRRDTIHANASLADVYQEAALFLLLVVLIEATCTNAYKGILKRSDMIEALCTLKHTAILMVMLILYLFLNKHSTEYSRYVYSMTFIINYVLTFSVRGLWKRVFKKLFAKASIGKDSMILVTVKSEAKVMIEHFRNDFETMYKLRGVILMDGGIVGDMVEGVKIVANYDDVYEYLSREWVDEVFLYVPSEYKNKTSQFIYNCMLMGLTVHENISSSYEGVGYVRTIGRLGGYTVISSSVNRITMGQAIVKRAFDIVGGLVGLFLTAILFVFIAPMIYIKSPGPIFFKQRRIGRNGKQFYIYKFRSMYLDAEERKAALMKENNIKDGMMFKMKNDPRIIGGEKGKGIGNFIRNTSIDEFPQFLNVLKGDMSLVGTRPPTLDEWNKYKLHHRKRMAIKPGLTGMWQVSGRSNITDFEEVVKLDTQYITNWSLTLDFLILLRTVKVVLLGEGSC